MDEKINTEFEWLSIFNGKIIDKIYQVDFNENRNDDIYLPWLFFITFLKSNFFLEIEGDLDGGHLRVNYYNNSELKIKLKNNNFPTEPDLWKVYETNKFEILGQLLGKTVNFIEYGIEKKLFTINESLVIGNPKLLNFIRFNCNTLEISVFEGSATGLGVSDDSNYKFNFEDTFDIYKT